MGRAKHISEATAAERVLRRRKTYDLEDEFAAHDECAFPRELCIWIHRIQPVISASHIQHATTDLAAVAVESVPQMCVELPGVRARERLIRRLKNRIHDARNRVGC